MAAVHTLLYIACDDEAEALGSTEHVDNHWPTLWLKHVGDRELVDLWRVLGGRPRATTLMSELIFQGSDEGPFVIRVPRAFVLAVAAIEPSRYHAVAAAWSQAAGLTDWRPDEIEQILRDLATFARQAEANRLSILQVAYL